MFTVTLYGTGIANTGRVVWFGSIGWGRIAGQAGKQDLSERTYFLCAGFEFLSGLMSSDLEMLMASLTYGKASRASASSLSWLSMNLPQTVSVQVIILTHASLI